MRGKRPVMALGAHVRFRGARWQVVALAGQHIHLAGEDGGDQAVLAGHLFADPDFAVLNADAFPPQAVPQWGLFETAPPAAREKALAWQRHVQEVDCGLPGGPADSATMRPQYDPARYTLAEREQAKAEELTAAGFGRISRTTCNACGSPTANKACGASSTTAPPARRAQPGGPTNASSPQ